MSASIVLCRIWIRPLVLLFVFWNSPYGVVGQENINSGSSVPASWNELVELAKKGEKVNNQIMGHFSLINELKDPYNVYEYNARYLKYLSDTVLALKYSISSGVSLAYSYNTFSPKNRAIDTLSVMFGPDRDQSTPGFLCYESKWVEPNLLEKRLTRLVLIDSTCLDGAREYFRNHVDIDSCEKPAYVWKYYLLNEYGKFVQLETDTSTCMARTYGMLSRRMVSAQELKEYTTDELRIMRNEIYASKGYSFKSVDLKEYFGSKPWYVANPEFSEEQFSYVEFRNIQLVKSLENQ